MTAAPLVSVVIPAHNAAPYIRETVESALKQTWQNLEIVIVNDNSSDGTANICNSLAINHSNIRVYHTNDNGSAAKARNFGIRHAEGEYIAFLDADDLWLPEKLRLQMNALLGNPGHSFIYAASVTFGDVNIFSELFEVLPLPWKSATTHEALRKGNPVTCSSVLCNKETLYAVGLFDENPENKSEDYDLWLSLSKIADALFLPAVLVKYRVHAAQLSNTGENRFRRLDYVSKKWNLSLSSNFSRRKNLIIRFVRNTLHLLSYIRYRAGYKGL